MTRAFVAIRPPEAVLDAVARIDLAVGRATTRDQWHVTLQFLGNDASIDLIAEALAGLDVAGGSVRLGGFGAFPKPGRARVVWLGVVEGADLMTAVATAVGARLEAHGYPPEDRPFHPHLTLARLNVPADVRRPLAAAPAAPVGETWSLDGISVFESTLHPAGARYAERARIPLEDT